MRYKDFSGAAEDLVVKDIRASHGWSVDVEPQFGSFRPDLLVTSPGGRRYVVEFKYGTAGGSASFSDIAQVSAYAKAIESAHPRRVRVVPIIATNVNVSEGATRLSDDLGVRVVARSKNPEQLARRVVDLIRRSDLDEDANPIVATLFDYAQADKSKNLADADE